MAPNAGRSYFVHKPYTTITDVDIPFGRLVMILLKVMLASIPALIVFYAIFFAIFFVIALLFGGLGAIVQNMG